MDGLLRRYGLETAAIRTAVQRYAEASLEDLFSTGANMEANWLPAPKGKFNLVLRIYSPRETPPSILDGTWTPPPVKRVQ